MRHDSSPRTDCIDSPAHPPDAPRVPPCLAEAIAYLHRGWPAVALCPPNHSGQLPPGHCDECTRPGKRPPRPWKQYQAQLPTEAELREAWGRNPGLNVGIILGQLSGLVGIDVDGPEGEAELQRLSAGDLPPTLQFSTPGGGYRLLYAWPAEWGPMPTTSFPTCKKPLHLLAEGSLTVMPPSGHVEGGQYVWVNAPDGPVSLTTAPDWMRGWRKQTRPTRTTRGGVPAAGLDDKLRQRVRAYLLACDPAISGAGGHNQTFKVACKLVDIFGLSEDAAFDAMWEYYNPKCDPPWSEPELRHKVSDAARRHASARPGASTNPTPAYDPPANRISPHVDNGMSTPAPSKTTGQNGNGHHASPQPKEQLPLSYPAEEFGVGETDWLWRHRISYGGITLFGGDTGVGKTALIMDVLARYTTGNAMHGEDAPGAWPGGGRALCMMERDPRTVVNPRLISAGVDMSRIHHFGRVPGKSYAGPMQLPSCVPFIRQELTRLGAKLLVIEPLSSFMIDGGTTNEVDMRRQLEPLADMLADEQVACLVSLHLNKNENAGNALYRLLGSAALPTITHNVFILTPHPDRPGMSVATHAKYSLGDGQPSLIYRTDGGRLVWEGEMSRRASDQLHQAEAKAKKKGVREAEHFLRVVLADGPVPSKDVLSEAEKAGVKPDPLKVAKCNLGVTSEPVTEPGRPRFWQFVPPAEWPAEE